MEYLVGLVINVLAAFLIVNFLPGIRLRDHNTAIAVSLSVGVIMGLAHVFLAPLVMLTLALQGYLADSRDLVTAVMYFIVGFGTAFVTLQLAEEMTGGLRFRSHRIVAAGALILALVQGLLGFF